MDILISIVISKGYVSFKRFLHIWDSDNPAYTEGCDAVIGYSLFKSYEGYKEDDDFDGGEIDYNSVEEGFETEEDAIAAVVQMIYGNTITYEYEKIA